ncbi:golgi transport 1B [Dissostichus eleginoides]|nr:golgi transport 1B [Dissostichus eleginoides]
MISLTDSQKIGMGLTGFGMFFLFFGMVLFFDKALLAIGNILFVAGLSFVIGLERTFRFFFQKHKVKATSFFLGGVLVVLIGWPIIGVVLEIYGFFLLFRGFFPVAVGFIRRVPVLGSLLSLPGISRVSYFVPFLSDMYGLITWDHWMNSAESQGLFEGPLLQIVPRQTLRALLRKDIAQFCSAPAERKETPYTQ